MTKRILILVCIVALAGCYKDTEEELYPDWSNTGGPTCDTTDVSFAATVKPIIEQNCLSGCHASAGTGGGYDFNSYAGVNLAKDRLRGAIRQDPGFSAMPKGGPRLNNCQVSQITAWVNQGAQNN